jgi:dihydroorotate dehydrogenase (fumarate)
MDETTSYLGLELPHPFVAGAGPLTDSLGIVEQVADAGAAAIVMRSLFEEQFSLESLATHRTTGFHDESFWEAMSYFPEPDAFALGPDEYLEHIGKIKRATGLPVIASLNGSTAGGWLRHAQSIQEAGADALELNLYYVATDADETSEAIEERQAGIVSEVRRTVSIPIAAKLAPFYTSCAHFAKRLEAAGADGIVVFNRFYEPDIDTEELELGPHLELSESRELGLRLRWLAILSPQLRCSLAVSGGVHTAQDAIKAVMAGANVVQMVSALLVHGPAHLARVRREMKEWMEEKEYESVRQMTGSMNLERCPDPASFARGNYLNVLHTWR